MMTCRWKRSMLLIVVLVVLPAFGGPNSAGADSDGQCRRKLRVVVYPFIPRYREVLYTIKSRFEQANQSIELDLIDLSSNYYAAEKKGKPAKDYIGTTDADVYELDSVLLKDFVDSKRIRPLPQAAQIPDNQLLKNAVAGSTIDGIRYGAPHWVCGNFLFFRADDVPMRSVRNAAELANVIGPRHAMGEGLLTDLKGSLTLGEFYLEAATDHYGWPESASHVLAIDKPIADDLKTLIDACDADFCRNTDYHGTEVYGRAFSRRRGRALIGYSETLNQVLSESANCTKPEMCLTDSGIDVARLSLDSAGAHQISWVDSFVISSHCSGVCLQNATAFLRFMNDDHTFRSILQPSEDAVPAYLLPAKASMYSDPVVTQKAHLYEKLKTIMETAVAPSTPKLNDQLRKDGSELDGQLPSH
jgi:thiamine pyridinylase